MIGIVIAAHGDLAAEFLKTASLFSQNNDYVETVSFLPGDSIDKLYTNLKTAVNNADSGSGVVVLTDMEGGSPSNQASRLIMEGWSAEVISGVNMPMLLTVLFERDGLTREELSEKAADLGQRGIASLRAKVLNRLQSQARQPDDMDEAL